MRRWTLLAPALALAALAAVPAVTIAAGQRGARDTLRVCHAVGDGAYESRQARETDFSGTARQGHGEHDADIAPPFTIEDPQPGESSSFPGRLWGDRGQRIYDAGCVATAPVPGATPEPRPEAEPPAKVRICHATSSRDNPYVSNEPEIANNGELQGGHLDHKGPVYPDEDWGDIIPPYTYVDRNGEPHAFPGYNWTEGGQAIYANGCEPAHPPTPQPLTPILECVEDTGGKLLAHFGYRNPNATSVEPPAGQNVFSPPPEQRGQPTAFRPGRVEDAFQAEFTGAALTWSLMGNQVSAANGSQRCQGSISIVKRVVPSDDPGLFGLKIDGEVKGGAGAVGDGGSTGTIAVETGRRTVSESGAEGTQLGDYTVQIVCRTNGGAGEVVAGENGTSVVVNVRHNEAIVCTITNEIEQEPDTVSPMLECVVFNEGGPDVAVWGYQNSNDHPVTIPIGSENKVHADARRPRPTVDLRGGSPRRCRPDALRSWSRKSRLDPLGRYGDGFCRLASLHGERRAAEGARTGRRPRLVPTADQRRAARDGRPRGDHGACRRRHRGRHSQRDCRTGHEPLGLRLQRRVHAERDGRGLRTGYEG